MKTLTVIETTSKEITISPCVKCGNEDIEIYNCGYSSFNASGGKCKKCKHKVETGASWDVNDSVLVEAWNKANNPKLLIDKLKNDKQKIDEEIKKLEAIL